MFIPYTILRISIVFLGGGGGGGKASANLFNYFILRCTRISSFIGLLSVSETTFARTLSGYNLAVGLFGRPIEVRRLAVHVRQSFSLITSSVTASFYLILGQSSCINTTSQIWMFCSFFPVML